MEPFLGEIRLVPLTFAPKGWALCHGQLLPINQNQALFALLWDRFGGNGTTNFALPDLRNRTIVGTGQGQGLSTYALGDTFGAAEVVLTQSELPAHNHSLNVSSAAATGASPIGAYPAVAPAAVGAMYGADAVGSMPNALTPVGGGQSHENRQPFLTLNYIIALQGIFPSPN